MIYLDTSALIKRFLVEPGSPLVYSLLTSEPRVATAKIAYAEAYGVLTRKQRAGDLSRVQYALAAQRFEEEWRVLTRVDGHDEILVLARELIQRHPLRAFDAIHHGRNGQVACCQCKLTKATPSPFFALFRLPVVTP